MAMQPKLSASSSFSSRLWLPRRPRFLLLLLLSVISASLLLLLLLLASPLLLSSPPSFLLRPYLLRPHHALSSFPVLDFLSNPLPLNSTLLAFAQIDLNEPEERRQISHILDGTWPRSSPRRSYDSRRDRFDDRLAVDHYSDRFSVERRRYQRPRARLPIQLTSPRYAPYWPQFRRSLQGWVQNKRHEPQVMNRLLHLVKDRVDTHYMSRMMINNSSVEFGKPYRTCAVVGNSGILLNQSFAELIDSHDMVMRLNNARIMGFERFVGSKTTISFVNSNILHSCTRRNDCFCHPYGVDVPMIMYICQVVHFMDIALCGASHRAPIIVTDPRLDTLCARIVKYYSLKRFIETTGRKPEEWSDAHEGPLFHYSSGMEAVMLAVGMCEKVSIFGFGKSTAAKHHYHTNQKMELRLHDYGAEYQFYMDLATRKSHLIPFLNEAGFTIPSVQIYW